MNILENQYTIKIFEWNPKCYIGDGMIHVHQGLVDYFTHQEGTFYSNRLLASLGHGQLFVEFEVSISEDEKLDETLKMMIWCNQSISDNINKINMRDGSLNDDKYTTLASNLEISVDSLMDIIKFIYYTFMFMPQDFGNIIMPKHRAKNHWIMKRLKPEYECERGRITNENNIKEIGIYTKEPLFEFW